MKLPTIEEIKPKSKVILRIDADLPMKDGAIIDNSRLMKSLPTIKKLIEKECQISIIGHLGRPTGTVKELSLKPIYAELMTLLKDVSQNENHIFMDSFDDKKKIGEAMEVNNIIFFENLRFWSGEEENNPAFLLGLIELSDVFVNDAFAVAHRVCASVMIHKFLPTFYGDSFVEEANKISKAVEDPAKPITVILGGAKADKLKYVRELAETVDYILIGGKLPDLIDNDLYRFSRENPKLIIGNFNISGLDIDQETIDRFVGIISFSKTIIWVGAMGMYEMEENKKGTSEIAKAMAKADAYTVIAGGDTIASISGMGLADKIDYLCSGGGVMLEYMSKKSLPAWQ